MRKFLELRYQNPSSNYFVYGLAKTLLASPSGVQWVEAALIATKGGYQRGSTVL